LDCARKSDRKKLGSWIDKLLRWEVDVQEWGHAYWLFLLGSTRPSKFWKGLARSRRPTWLSLQTPIGSPVRSGPYLAASVFLFCQDGCISRSWISVVEDRHASQVVTPGANRLQYFFFVILKILIVLFFLGIYWFIYLFILYLFVLYLFTNLFKILYIYLYFAQNVFRKLIAKKV